MAGHRYWKLGGELEKSVRAIWKRHMHAHRQIRAIVKREGAEAFGTRMAFGREVYSLLFKEKPGRDWRPIAGNYYDPKLNTKRGKELESEIRDIEETVAVGSEVSKLIGMNEMRGCSWRNPGIDVRGRFVIIVTDDDYTPPKKVAAHMKRISDLDYERLTKQ